MRIGLIIGLHGSSSRAPRWSSVRDQALAAEREGFDLAVIEDALLYRDDDGTIGYWEAVSMAGAMCAATTSITIGHSVLNTPYRSAGLTAKIAETLDEISGGRFFLGIGLGNTIDYRHFGVAADKRYSRFAEAIEIIHDLLRSGRADFEGTYQFARDAELVLRGPRANGPPIIIAARGPKMLRLTARFADGWNWWSGGKPDAEELGSLAGEMDRACHEVGRDPATLRRSLDVYSVDPLGKGAAAGDVISGRSEEIAEQLLQLGALGFDELRCNLVSDGHGDQRRAIEAMAEVVSMVRGSRREPLNATTQEQLRRHAGAATAKRLGGV
jgi:alkanesulfonate monooxygenase SsuD/methylene tetrahydromethanopterin reductase-like flavin-dependent oxidoreductase (luciferase family)